MNIDNTPENWENGALGAEEKFQQAISTTERVRMENALGLQSVTLKLSSDLVKIFHVLAEKHGMDEKSLMREALDRFAESELKQIVTKKQIEECKTNFLKAA